MTDVTEDLDPAGAELPAADGSCRLVSQKNNVDF